MRDRQQAPVPSLWDATAHWVEASLGLHFPPRLWPDLQRGLAAAARRLDLPDAVSCAQRALTGQLDVSQQQVLAESLTIGETYFFRDPVLFEQLATQVLRPLIESRRQGSRHLRLWSAGCSSGEEPYSLAMLLAHLLPEWREWNISILATDLSTAALDKGRAASYGPWSLRGDIPPQYRQFLREGPDGRSQVDPALRGLVQFAQLNLASTAYPSSATLTTGMDLVLCRNVLIYFEPAGAARVLARLGRALAPDGWLVTGSVELPQRSVEGLRKVRSHGLFALRRTLAGGPGSPAHPGDPVPLPRPRAKARPTLPPPILQLAPAPTPAPAAPAVAPAPAGTLLQQARQRADTGDLAGALVLCREAVERDKLDADATYLLATVLTEAGATLEAMEALQRTLYLDPDHLLARFALGSLAVATGRTELGRRYLARALAQLECLPGDEVLQGGGGLTSRELQRAIRRLEAAAR